METAFRDQLGMRMNGLEPELQPQAQVESQPEPSSIDAMHATSHSPTAAAVVSGARCNRYALFTHFGHIHPGWDQLLLLRPPCAAQNATCCH
jgi:hypothetical protein